jgi:hypothetical protein
VQPDLAWLPALDGVWLSGVLVGYFMKRREKWQPDDLRRDFSFGLEKQAANKSWPPGFR